MTEPTPSRAVNCTDTWYDGARQPADPALVIAWDQVRDRIAGANTYWVTTVRPDGSPHTRPVFAVWTEGQLCSTTNPTRAKARHLSRNPQVCFGTHADGIDLVVEGTAAFVTDAARLERIAEAYRDKYGWPLELRDGELTAPFGAPAAGTPPYRPYALTPTTVYAMGTTDELAPRSTRFTFG